MPRVVEWSEPPQMCTGVPLPVVERVGSDLVVVYICGGPETRDHCAVVRFSGVQSQQFGYPNDEGLWEHRFYGIGLRHYAFWEVVDSPDIPVGSSLHHWIATFHDETLEVVGTSATVIARKVSGTNTSEIARRFT